MDTPVSEAPPPVLQNLIAADLVNHEMIGDPARLGGEAACLRALCALVGGSVYRIDPYHYAFQADRDDLGGGLAERASEDWAAALETALQERLGADAVWVNATPPPVGRAAGAADGTASGAGEDAGATADAAPLVYLKAFAGAVAGVTPPDPGLQAVINARYAAETARLTAGAAPGEALDGRLGGIEGRLEAISETMLAMLRRLEAAEAALGRVEAAGGAAAFQDTVGLALAEFLARLERRAEAAAAPAVGRASPPPAQPAAPARAAGA